MKSIRRRTKLVQNYTWIGFLKKDIVFQPRALQKGSYDTFLRGRSPWNGGRYAVTWLWITRRVELSPPVILPRRSNPKTPLRQRQCLQSPTPGMRSWLMDFTLPKISKNFLRQCPRTSVRDGRIALNRGPSSRMPEGTQSIYARLPLDVAQPSHGEPPSSWCS